MTRPLRMPACGLNAVAGDQYGALVLPVTVFRAGFTRRGLAPFSLSRLAADRAAIISPLIAWNSCRAYMGAVLGCFRVPVRAVRNFLLREPGAGRPVRQHRVKDREAVPSGSERPDTASGIPDGHQHGCERYPYTSGCR